MHPSIRVFLSISIGLLLLSACQSIRVAGESIENHQKEYTISYFNEIGEEYMYKAKITAYGNDLNGIFVIKNLDKNQKRTALLSDFGNTILDMELTPDETIIHYVIDDLDRKIILNRFKKYFQLLLQSDYVVTAAFQSEDGRILKSKFQKRHIYLMLNEEDQLTVLKQSTKYKEKVIIDYDIKDDSAKSIFFESKEIPLKIWLEKIKM
ncbi:MAG: hypothetical protein WC994_02615 [Brumimicrobium sp.]